jgi:hypothetical protein
VLICSLNRHRTASVAACENDDEQPHAVACTGCYTASLFLAGTLVIHHHQRPPLQRAIPALPKVLSKLRPRCP